MNMNNINLKTKIQTKYDLNTYFFESIDSTNEEIKKDIYTDNTLIIAKEQTSGKGRNSKSFCSKEGGIYMSLKIPLPDFDMTALTSLTAVAVMNSIYEITENKPQIKWVNDIILNNKKICGILLEAVSNNTKVSSIIIGIGINLKHQDFPKEIKNIAGSIEEILGVVPNKEDLIFSIIDNIYSLINTSSPKEIYNICRENSFIIGKEIIVTTTDDSFCATALDIDQNGRLVVLKGNVKTVLSYGEISIKI